MNQIIQGPLVHSGQTRSKVGDLAVNLSPSKLGVIIMNQLGFPSAVTPQEIARKTTLGGAITLCAEAAGLEPKEVQHKLKTDKAQWSRWASGDEGIIWPKLCGLMDLCGNDAPLLWMNCRRGYDLNSLRRKETETERILRGVEDALREERMKYRVLVEAMHGRVTA